jgi:hypothetical protein
MFPASMLCENGWCAGCRYLAYPDIPPFAICSFITSRSPDQRIMFPRTGLRALIFILFAPCSLAGFDFHSYFFYLNIHNGPLNSFKSLSDYLFYVLNFSSYKTYIIRAIKLILKFHYCPTKMKRI